MRRVLVVAILALVLTYSIIPVDCYVMSVEIEKDKIHVKITSLVEHNFTELRHPDLVFSGQDLSNANTVIEKAIGTKQNTATIKNLLLSVSLSSERIRLDAEFDVSGTVLVEGAILKANCSWRSFDVSENLHKEDVFWNRVGEKYFVPRIDRLENMTPTRFYFNQTSAITSNQTKDILKELRMLDFRPLAAPLSAWTQTRSLAENKTRWTLKLGRTLDLRARQEAESPNVQFVVFRSIDAEISAAGYATLQGETIRTDIGTGQTEMAMLTTVLTLTIAAISTHLVARRKRR